MPKKKRSAVLRPGIRSLTHQPLGHRAYHVRSRYYLCYTLQFFRKNSTWYLYSAETVQVLERLKPYAH